jgi:hypothetical protein
MKSITNYSLIMVIGLLLLLNACDPIEERDSLKNTYKAEDIKLEVIQTAGGKGNGLTLKMNTPGISGYWDYLIDRKFTDVVNDVIFPIPGTHTFTYYASTPRIKDGDPSKREYVSKSISVTIEELDQPLPSAYYKLVGEELTSKTWVFDGTGGDNRQWFFMSDPGNPWGQWWNAGGECCPPDDVNGKMVFDLDNAANYSYYSSPQATAEKGSFSFNGDFTKLYIGGGLNILGAKYHNSGNPNSEYTIVELTEERLVLFTNSNGAGTGWTWVFVPEED